MTSYRKRIICLANSRKVSGRCIAGKVIDDGQARSWIRPVSDRPAGELSEYERRYEGGADPTLLDVIDVWMLEPRPHGFQTENHLIDPELYWQLVRKATAAELTPLIDVVNEPLWNNDSSSTGGIHDRVQEATALQFENSLKLIDVSAFRVSVGVEGAAFNNAKRKVRGSFVYNGTNYRLMVTDPVVERRYLAGENGQFDLGSARLCISLGDTFGGYAYKLIAGVLPRT